MSKKLSMLVAVLLLCAMLMAGLVSCVSDKGETEVTTDAPEGTGGEQDTAETKLTSGIGDDVTFDGEEVHWFIWKDVTMDEFYVDEMTGDEIQDQIFLRNKDIQKKYTFHLKLHRTVI